MTKPRVRLLHHSDCSFTQSALQTMVENRKNAMTLRLRIRHLLKSEKKIL